jgi:protein TonB
MSTVNTTSLTLEDIVFENRNKAYGAYDLRLAYERNMLRAIIVTPLAMLLTFGGVFGFNALIPGDVPVEDTPMKPTDPNKFTSVEVIIEKPEVAPKPPAKINSKQYTGYKPVPDKTIKPDEKITTVDELKNSTIEPVTIDDGVDGGENPVDFVEKGTGDGGLEGNSTLGTDTELKEFIIVEQMPEFPGGQEAMIKFLSKHLRFPHSAVSQNLSGVVYVSFVISPEGKVTKIEVLKGINADCDAEAIRVVGKMPKWKPGHQSGRTVAVRYNLPIRFSVNTQN